MMAEYTVVLEYDAAGKVYIARVPALRGVISQGATEQEALSNVEDALKEWIVARRGLGLPIPEAKECRIKVAV